ncbi:ankyrin, partial [Amniculicola lignicola CBS 123094]
DINVANSEGNNPLHIAAMSGSYDVAQYLLGLGADVDARSTDASKRTPLMFAAIHGSITVLHALLEAGAILDLPDNSGKTALELAV